LTFKLAYTNFSTGVTYDSKHYYYFGCWVGCFSGRHPHFSINKKQRNIVRMLLILRNARRFTARRKKRFPNNKRGKNGLTRKGTCKTHTSGIPQAPTVFRLMTANYAALRKKLGGKPFVF
jgi:hypothetical protein